MTFKTNVIGLVIGLFVVIASSVAADEYILINEPYFRYKASPEEFWVLNDSFSEIFDDGQTLYKNLEDIDFGPIINLDLEARLVHKFGNQIIGDDDVYLGNVYSVEYGTPVSSPVRAVVYAVDYDPHWLGYYIVLLKLGSNIPIRIAFGHLQNIFVQVGDIVEVGQTIAETGATGGTNQSELFIGVKYGSVYVEPTIITKESELKQ